MGLRPRKLIKTKNFFLAHRREEGR